MFNEESVSVVNICSYIGIMFTNKLCLRKMVENMADKRHSVLTKLFSAFSYNVSIFFKIFEIKIASILSYGSEIWGLTYTQCTEIVHVAACKRFLNVPKYARNNSVLGDLGRPPMYLYSC